MNSPNKKSFHTTPATPLITVKDFIIILTISLFVWSYMGLVAKSQAEQKQVELSLPDHPRKYNWHSHCIDRHDFGGSCKASIIYYRADRAMTSVIYYHDGL